LHNAGGTSCWATIIASPTPGIIRPSSSGISLQTISSGRLCYGEICNQATDGSIYWADTTIVPFLDAQGVPYRYIAFRSEITKRKQQGLCCASRRR
jgi:PAS domain-containing protein